MYAPEFTSDSIYGTYSMAYSRETVINLKREYEVENNFQYDCVILMRYDHRFMNTKNNPSGVHNFHPWWSMNYVYTEFGMDLILVYLTSIL